MTSITQSLTSKNGLLRIRFARLDDRFQHSVEHRRTDVEDWRTLLESVEGTPSESWPPSPPYQQVEQHVAGSENTCLLAVGLAGSSHWSATVEEVYSGDQLRDAETRLRFDVACRIKPGAANLGSVYAPADSASIPASSERGIQFDFDGCSIRLEGESIGAIDRQIAITPGLVSRTETTTVRWVYDFVSIQSE